MRSVRKWRIYTTNAMANNKLITATASSVLIITDISHPFRPAGSPGELLLSLLFALPLPVDSARPIHEDSLAEELEAA